MLRDVWEETSFALERLQRVESVVEQEESGLKDRTSEFSNNQGSPRFTATACKFVAASSWDSGGGNESGLRHTTGAFSDGWGCKSHFLFFAKLKAHSQFLKLRI